MKEGALVGLVTIGLLVLLVGIVASGLEDSGLISMARHFPVTAVDLNRAVTLGQGYHLCQRDFIDRNQAQYRDPSTLATSSATVCAAKLALVSEFLASRHYSAEVIAREVTRIKQDEDSATQKRVAAPYRGPN
jgi:hypothetical protein